MPEKIAYSLGDLIGAITWPLVPKKRRKMALKNAAFSLNLPPQEALPIVKKSWTQFGRIIVEVMRFPIIKKNIHSYIEIKGKENLDAALSLGKGGIIATSHSDNWELLGATLAQSGYKVVAISQEQTNLGADKFINEYRASMGLFPMYKYSVRNMFKMIKEGWLIGLVMDQDAAEDGIVMPFLGRNASCAHGAATIARPTGAPIIPIFITKKGEKKHLVSIEPAIFVEKGKNKHHDIREATFAVTKIIEQHILAHPTEWLWLHDRWKSVDRHRATKTYE